MDSASRQRLDVRYSISGAAQRENAAATPEVKLTFLPTLSIRDMAGNFAAAAWKKQLTKQADSIILIFLR